MMQSGWRGVYKAHALRQRAHLLSITQLNRGRRRYWKAHMGLGIGKTWNVTAAPLTSCLTLKKYLFYVSVSFPLIGRS